jgi:hypothetical protein
VIPGCVPFSSAIADYPRTPVSLAELTNWKGNPDPLLGSYFIASGDNAEDDEIFQVISLERICKFLAEISLKSDWSRAVEQPIRFQGNLG